MGRRKRRSLLGHSRSLPTGGSDTPTAASDDEQPTAPAPAAEEPAPEAPPPEPASPPVEESTSPAAAQPEPEPKPEPQPDDEAPEETAPGPTTGLVEDPSVAEPALKASEQPTRAPWDAAARGLPSPPTADPHAQTPIRPPRSLSPPSLGEVLALASEVAALGTPAAAERRSPVAALSPAELEKAHAWARERIGALPKGKRRSSRWPSRAESGSKAPFYATPRAMLLGFQPPPKPELWYDPGRLTHDDWQILVALASMALTMILAGAIGVLVLLIALGPRVLDGAPPP